jgi:cell division transport system permease protein
MKSSLKQAVIDIRDNRFIHLVAMITISFSVVVCGAFYLCWSNISRWVDEANADVRMMVYLQPECSADQIQAVFTHIRGIKGVAEARFISKDQAMEEMKELIRQQASLLEGLRTNPFPDAFEIRLLPDMAGPESLTHIASGIQSFPGVENVEYARKWLERFTGVVQVIQLIGYALITLFFMASAFIVANTARLIFLSKQEEIEIMRLVGATDRFISSPIYLEGILQGAVGGLLGMGLLYVLHVYLSSHIHRSMTSGFFTIGFLPPSHILWGLAASILAGWIGCLIAVKPFLRA